MFSGGLPGKSAQETDFMTKSPICAGMFMSLGVTFILFIHDSELRHLNISYTLFNSDTFIANHNVCLHP